MDKWQTFKIFVSRNYTNYNTAMLWKLGDEVVSEIEKHNKNIFWVYYDYEKNYPEGPHIRMHIKNPNEQLLAPLKEKYDIDDEGKADESFDDKEGLIAKQIYDRVKSIEDLQELADTLKEDKDYLGLKSDKGKHYLFSMLKVHPQMENEVIRYTDSL